MSQKQTSTPFVPRNLSRSNRGVPPDRYNVSTLGNGPSKTVKTPPASCSSNYAFDKTSQRSSKSSKCTVKSNSAEMNKLHKSASELVEQTREIGDLKIQLIEAQEKQNNDLEIIKLESKIETLESIRNINQQSYKVMVDNEQKSQTGSIKDSMSATSIHSKVKTWIESVKESIHLPPGENLDDLEDSESVHLPQAQVDTNGASKSDLLMAIREVMRTNRKPPNLPEFDGNDIMQWPAFISEFDRSTRKFHVENSENLRRLSFALKGKAKSAVQHLLSHPDNVQRIIRLLENNYGRKEWILLNLKEKARNLPQVKEDDIESHKRFFNDVMGIIGTMKSIGGTHYLEDFELIICLANKMPQLSRAMWGRHKLNLQSDQSTVTLDDFADWVETDLQTMFCSHDPSVRKPNMRPQRKDVFFNRTDPNCFCCDGKEKHYLYKCAKFNEMSIKERRDFVKEARLCFNCFRKGHGATKCKSEHRCKKCDGPHHTMLHMDATTQDHPDEADQTESQE